MTLQELEKARKTLSLEIEIERRSLPYWKELVELHPDVEIFEKTLNLVQGHIKEKEELLKDIKFMLLRRAMFLFS
jgi:hypothetical protein